MRPDEPRHEEASHGRGAMLARVGSDGAVPPRSLRRTRRRGSNLAAQADRVQILGDDFLGSPLEIGEVVVLGMQVPAREPVEPA